MDVALIRKEVIAFRKELSGDECRKMSAQVCERIEAFLKDYPFSNDFLCYYPLEKEVDLRPLYHKLLQQNKNLYFPKTKEEGIFFYKVDSLEDFYEGRFHVMEPISEKISFLGDEKALCFVPGLAFSKDFHRIGYGGGYYDGFLSQYKVLKIGTCFEKQMMDFTPKSHDVDMDVIVTENMILH